MSCCAQPNCELLIVNCYRVNELFYTLQGEGYHTGRAAVFVRMAGCNLRCPFCDTQFDSYQPMTASDIVAAACHHPSRFVVLTGGEPTLQVDSSLVDALHAEGFFVAMESNGTRPAPDNLDWLTVSPKGTVAVDRCDEVKLVFTKAMADDFTLVDAQSLPAASHHFLQPCDTGHAAANVYIINRCIAYILQHPQWRLSLQTHKLVGFK